MKVVYPIFWGDFLQFHRIQHQFGLETFGYFCLEILIIIAISLWLRYCCLLLNKIQHHINRPIDYFNL
jgi:hypothetical protein